MTETPARKRRWFRFSLRTMLIVIMLLSPGLGLASLARIVSVRTRQQKRILNQLYGCRIGMEAKWRFGYVRSVSLFTKAGARDPTVPSDRWASHLKGLSRLDSLLVEGPADVTDAALLHIKEMDSLRRLTLKDTAITDAGLVHLAEMKNLEYLAVEGTGVSWDGMDKLKKTLPNCEVSSWARSHH